MDLIHSTRGVACESGSARARARIGFLGATRTHPARGAQKLTHAHMFAGSRNFSILPLRLLRPAHFGSQSQRLTWQLQPSGNYRPNIGLLRLLLAPTSGSAAAAAAAECNRRPNGAEGGQESLCSPLWPRIDRRLHGRRHRLGSARRDDLLLLGAHRTL